jgi:hypothetical protein
VAGGCCSIDLRRHPTLFAMYLYHCQKVPRKALGLVLCSLDRKAHMSVAKENPKTESLEL